MVVFVSRQSARVLATKYTFDAQRNGIVSDMIVTGPPRCLLAPQLAQPPCLQRVRVISMKRLLKTYSARFTTRQFLAPPKHR
ncbi:unnamed protein product, partial [Iphiclides podalirius]